MHFDKKRREMLGDDPKYQFEFGPEGLRMEAEEYEQLDVLAGKIVRLLRTAREWYVSKEGQHHWLSGVLRKGYPKRYNGIQGSRWSAMPAIVMVDTIWTSTGWQPVEVDATNRNAYGYPPLLRELYGLPSSWEGIDVSLIADGWRGVTQIMADQCRFYEPYYRYLMQLLGGRLVREEEIEAWLAERKEMTVPPLLDLPPLYHCSGLMDRLLEVVSRARVAIPPYHWMASKALMALPSLLGGVFGDEFVDTFPETRLLQRKMSIPASPQGGFFVKYLQSSGTHGTFADDMDQLRTLSTERKPRAIWQATLPLARRNILVVSGARVRKEARYVRCSILVRSRDGKIVDADITARDSPIVHGAKDAALTVAVA